MDFWRSERPYANGGIGKALKNSNKILLMRGKSRPGLLFNILYRKETLQEYSVTAVKLLTFVLKSYQLGCFKPCEEDVVGKSDLDRQADSKDEVSFHYDEAMEDIFEDEDVNEDTIHLLEASIREGMDFEDEDDADDENDDAEYFFDSAPITSFSHGRKAHLTIDLSNSQLAACKEVQHALGLIMQNNHSSALAAKLFESTLDLFIAIFTKQPKGVHKGTEKSCIEPFLALVSFNFKKGVFKSCKQMTPALSKLMYLNQYCILKKVLQSPEPLK